jgi:PAS domain S-box-containing protein
MKEGERFRRAFEEAAIGIALLAVEPLGQYLEANPTFCRMTGYSREELLSRDFQSITAPQDLDKNLEKLRSLLGGAASFQTEKRYVRKDGSSFWSLIHVSLVRDDQARPLYITVQIEDIDERKRAEAALRNEEKRLLQLVEQIPAVLWTTDTELTFTLSVGAGLAGLGLTPNQVVGMTLFEFFQTQDPEYLPIQASRRALNGESVSYETGWKDRVFQSYVEPLRDPAGRIIGVIGFALDITARERAEAALRDSSRFNEQIIRSAREGIVVHDRELRYRTWNPYMEELTGLRAELVLGKSPQEMIPVQQEHGKHFLTEANIKEILDGLTRALAGEAVTRPDLPLTLKENGRTSWHTVRYDPLQNAQGEIVGVIVTAREITDRKRAEEELRESSRFNQQIIANAREGIIVYDRELRYVVWNSFMEELTGLRMEEVIGKHLWDLGALYQDHGKISLSEETVKGIRAGLERALAGETFAYVDVPMDMKESGLTGWTSARYGPFRNAQGEIIGVIATVRDITERKRLEEQLQHAQKLEAIGQLAGGVAHEFNNTLTAIMGNLDLALAQLSSDSDQHSTLTVAFQAARRAAMLTQQLLTFSHRGATDLQPQDLGSIATEVVRLLRQTIDRRIQLYVRYGDGLWPVLSDVGQMNQVIMNLCVNARDSLAERMNEEVRGPIPPGWEPRIEIAIQNVSIDEAYCKQHYEARPGDCVCLSVSDNGCGVDEEIRQHIFEPFFTTKEVGRGTGLGLATVYGIVKQHEGWIDLSSAQNTGTTFKIYLPRTLRTAAPPPRPVSRKAIVRGTETILFVDDEAPIRRLGQTILEHHGYTVLLAENGEQALEIFRRERDRIRLVVLDLTMPRMSGREVLKQLLGLDPNMPVLISSGHQIPSDGGQLQAMGKIEFIPKPYRPDDLARSVRSLLNAPAVPS